METDSVSTPRGSYKKRKKKEEEGDGVRGRGGSPRGGEWSRDER